ncbi:AraC family transcriptional regulator [Alteromonadaceae bacterium M269]|nr:AraC family transcriptional regulator [Alteromonadaceae bacterium M269]
MRTQFKLTRNEESWIGSSDVLFTLKQQINKLAHSTLPVHIIGAPGTGKRIAAHHIHKLSANNDGKFIVSCCKHWNKSSPLKELESMLSQAQEGTLYIKNIDNISQDQFELIKDYWLNDDINDHSVRLITSATASKQGVDTPIPTTDNLLSWLYYHCLELALPKLYDRKDDITPLINYYKSIDSNIAKITICDDALALLKSYDWPNNVKQLKRCLDKLAFVNGSGEIHTKTLLDMFPAMQTEDSQPQAKVIPMPSVHHIETSSNGIEEKHSATSTRYELQGDSFRINLKLNQAPDKSKSHPALTRALQYLEDNYTKPLSLNEVAEHACVSPSHLSFLFKRYVGQSFKQTLLRLRINAAMVLLRENPFSQVTEVCDDVGFSDLSFFVRKFKAVVGYSPGAYRDQSAKY